MNTCPCAAPAPDANICHGHASKLRTLIERTPSVLVELDTTITKQAVQGGAHGGPSGEPELIVNLRASDARQRLEKALYALAVAGQPAIVQVARNVPTHVKVTLTALAGLRNTVRRENAYDLYTDLVAAHAEALAVMDRAEERITYGKCQCGVELSAPKSRDTATCRNCGATYGVQQIRVYRYAAALDALETKVCTLRQLVTLLNVASGHKVTARTVKHWTERKNDRLEPVGERDGVKVYAFSDARKLAEKAEKTR